MRHDGDFFEAGNDLGRFEAGDQSCQIAARDYVSYDVHGLSGTSYARTRSYNAVYDRCMTGKGFSPRPYEKSWLPQG